MLQKKVTLIIEIFNIDVSNNFLSSKKHRNKNLNRCSKINIISGEIRVESSSVYPADIILAQRSNEEILERASRPEQATVKDEQERPTAEIKTPNHQFDQIASNTIQASDSKSVKDEKSEAISISSELSETASVKKLSESIADKFLLDEEYEEEEEEDEEVAVVEAKEKAFTIKV